MGEAKLPTLVAVRINSVHQAMITRLIEESGFSSQADVFRAGVRALYKQEFKDYLDKRRKTVQTKAEEEKLTEDQKILRDANPAKYCSDVLGGTLVEIDGQSYCEVDKGNGMTEYVSLSGV